MGRLGETLARSTGGEEGGEEGGREVDVGDGELEEALEEEVQARQVRFAFEEKRSAGDKRGE